MLSKCYLNTFNTSSIDAGPRLLFMSIWMVLVLSFQFGVAQVENDNSSFSFPSNNSDDSNSLLKPPPQESPYFKGNFLEKPLHLHLKQ